MRFISIIEDESPPGAARQATAPGRPGWRGQQELPLEPGLEAEMLDPPFHDDPS